VDFGQMMVLPAPVSHALALAPGVVILLVGLRTRARRTAVRLSAPSLAGLVVRAVVVTVVLQAIVAYLDHGRGVPLMFGVFLGLAIAMDYALTRTRWGRSMSAVGGNREAARRAGINVRAIYTSAFVLCAGLASLGGVLAAARLASASQQAGTGDVNLNAIAAAVIGGTSLFGGRGNAFSAVLGVIVIQSIASGLTLLNLSSSLRFMITGAVLAIAVIVDSLARRSRLSHGRA
jgi:D-xylose transport system permease protein